VDILLEDYEDTLEEEAVEFLNTISDSIDRMKKLVKSLLDYSRLGATKTLGQVDCNQLIKQTLEDLDSKIKDNNATITVEDLPTLEGYETELRLLFQNLIGNAIKFQRPGNKPEISIGVQKENGWTFSIQDNGIGISTRNQERIFSIFQQLNPKTEFEGTGIGLAHCKKIAAMHNGDIWVQSVLGEGSTFYFNINL
jgi:light-regulated signal transduction histidine kinase (bacteriophytochrome)